MERATSGSRSGSRSETAGEYLSRLAGEPADAEAALRELWDAPLELLPDLILEVENRTTSQLKEVTIYLVDSEGFGRWNDAQGQLQYKMPGMGRFHYDDIAAGKTRSGRIKVVLRDFQRLPVGVLLRAALINRFRSRDYPRESDQGDLVGWWQRFYAHVSSSL